MIKKSHVSFLMFDALYVGLLCCVFNFRNLLVPSPIEIGPHASLFAVFYGLSHFFWFCFLIAFLLLLILRLLKSLKLLFIFTAFINGLLLAYVIADTFVWSQFRLHLNIAMLQMTFLGGRQIVPLSEKEIMEIAGLFVLCLLGGGILAFLAKLTATRIGGRGLVVGSSLVAIFLVTTIIYGWSFAKEKNEFLVAADVVPITAPITLALLTKHVDRKNPYFVN